MRSIFGGVAIAVSIFSAYDRALGADLTLPLLWSTEANQASAHLGYCSAAAGDVNGDGFTDLVIGVRDYDGGQANEGRAVAHHGTPSGFSPVPDWSFESNQALAFLGTSVASAGDVNGDGFHDVLVTAPSYDDGEENEGIVFLFLGSSTGLSLAPAWQRGGDQSTAAFGSSAAFAGDVNGDGYGDVIVGARGADGAHSNEGKALVYHGGATGLAATPAWQVTGAQVDPGFGWCVAGAGDVDGDGWSDVLVGAFQHDGGQSNEGAAFLYRGGASGLSTSPAWIGEGNQMDAGYGWSVAGAGDVNGDGCSDAIVGARYFQETLIKEGKAFVYLGGPSGLSSTPAWSAAGGEANAYFGWCVGSAGDVNGDGLADVVIGAPKKDRTWADAGVVSLHLGSRSSALTPLAWSVGSGQAGAQLGWFVAAAGDANGDGFGDLVGAAPYYDNGQNDEGSVFAYAGTPSLPETASSWRANGGTTSSAYGLSVAFVGDLDGNGMSDLAAADPYHSNGQISEGRVDVFLAREGGFDPAPDWSVESNQSSAFFGWAVAGAGDVNGDGYDDVLIGAPNWDGADPNEGRVTLYLGSASGLATNPSWTRTGGQSGANFGAALAGGGDANSDGFADFVVGAPLQNSTLADVGAIHWFRGSSSGPSALAQRMILGTMIGEEFGASVAHAGDANGDGDADVIVGAPGFSNGEPSEGIVRIILGSAAGLSASPWWSVEGNQAEARWGGSVAYAGDVNGDGITDVLASARFFDGGESGEGRAGLFLGSSTAMAALPDWTTEGNQSGAELDAVASAGDVDADGYSDVVAGASRATIDWAEEGVVHLFCGSPAGLNPTAAWSIGGGKSFANLGSALGGPGDANGDGFADLALGARGLADSSGTGGAALLFCGNGGAGSPRNLRQWRVSSAAPIALRGVSDLSHQFRIRGAGRDAWGRGAVALEIEVETWGDLFNGQNTLRGDWVETGAPDAELGSWADLEEMINGFYPGARLCWRARLRGQSPWFPGSPWITPSGNAPTEMDLRLSGFGTASPWSGPIQTPRHLAILSCVPHPIRNAAAIECDFPRAGAVELALFDVSGRRVQTIYEGEVSAGRRVIPWTLESHRQRGSPASGVYFLRLEGGDAAAQRRIVVFR